MWALKILNGPQAGTTYSLKEGDNFVGRSDSSDIKISSNGVSKKHCKLIVNNNQIIVLDLGSSNGTYINGKQVKESPLNIGDKISFHDVIADVQANVIPFPNQQHQQQNIGQEDFNPEQYDSQNFQSTDFANNSNNSDFIKKPKNIKEVIDTYIEDVLMPAVYRLIEMFELKWVLGCFVLAFIMLVTSLSTIPMLQITKSSIEKESQRRALTIARNIAFINQRLIQQGLTSSLTVSNALREEGVKLAVIIEADTGRVLAPASRAGSFENVPFINLARDISRYKSSDYVDTLGDQTIGASVPIRGFNPELQTTVISAFAVVIYDIGSLTIDEGQTISLFVQILAIACLLGFLLYFFMQKLITKPIIELNKSIDKAMKEQLSVESKYQFPELNALLLNINSLLSSSSSSTSEGGQLQHMDKSSEAQNMVRLFKDPSIAISTKEEMIDCNTDFENLLGVISGNIQNQNLDSLNDQALILSIQDLISRCNEQPNLIATNQIEFNGLNMEIDAQAISSNKGIDYYIIVIRQQGGFE